MDLLQIHGIFQNNWSLCVRRLYHVTAGEKWTNEKFRDWRPFINGIMGHFEGFRKGSIDALVNFFKAKSDIAILLLVDSRPSLALTFFKGASPTPPQIHCFDARR